MNLWDFKLVKKRIWLVTSPTGIAIMVRTEYSSTKILYRYTPNFGIFSDSRDKNRTPPLHGVERDPMPQFSAPTKFWIIVSQSIPSGFTLILNRGIIGPDTNLATGFRISRALSQFQGSANVHRVERGESCTMAPSWGVGDFFGVSNAISRTPVSLIFKLYSSWVAKSLFASQHLCACV